MLMPVGIAADVKPSAELTKPPTGYYKLRIKKAEDKVKEVAVRDAAGNETGKVKKTVLALTTHLDSDAHPNIDGSIPAYATEWFYADKDDSWTNGVFLALYMAAFNRDEPAVRAMWPKIDPALHLQPQNGVEKIFYVKWGNAVRDYTDKTGAAKKGDVLTVITPAAYAEGLAEQQKNATAAGGGAAPGDDPFAQGGGATNGPPAKAPTAAAPVSDDPFATMN